MTECQNCGSPLGKRQKKFCSVPCTNKFNASLLVSQNKILKPETFQVCLECDELLHLNKFSRVFKNKIDSPRRDVCKKCSARLRNEASLNEGWHRDAKKVLLCNSRKRAKDAGMDHTLTRDDIIIPEFCPVLGIRLQREGRETWHAAPSLDRVLNQFGYIPGNVMVISRRANILKRDASFDELIQIGRFYEQLKLSGDYL